MASEQGLHTRCGIKPSCPGGIGLVDLLIVRLLWIKVLGCQFTANTHLSNGHISNRQGVKKTRERSCRSVPSGGSESQRCKIKTTEKWSCLFPAEEIEKG